MAAGQVLKFKTAQVPKQQGELARLKVVQGPDSGSTFVIASTLAAIGRGEESHVMILDRKASRKHAEISYDVQTRSWKLKDLDSANGIQHNGKATKTAALRSGDTIALGETLFEFWMLEAGTQLLTAPAKNLFQHKQEQDVFNAQRAKVRGEKNPHSLPPLHYSPGAKTSGVGVSEGGSNRLLIYGGAAVLLFFILSSGQKNNAPAPEKKEAARDLASFMPQTVVDPPAETNRTVDQFFKSGFREYREKNYLRAKNAFEMVLQLNPSHVLARRYLDDCNKSIEGEVKDQLTLGVNNRKAGKMKAAQGNFEAVMRLLYRDPEHPDFIQAKDASEKIRKDLSSNSSGGNGT